MFSSFSNSNQEESPEQLYQSALIHKAQLSQQLDILKSASQALINMSQEEQLSLVSKYNIWSSIFVTLDQNIQDLTKRHPHLLIPSLPSGSMTGDHYTAPTLSTSSQNPFSFTSSSQLTFHPGVNTQAPAKPDQRCSVKYNRK
jgi:hypothetical protein